MYGKKLTMACLAGMAILAFVMAGCLTPQASQKAEMAPVMPSADNFVTPTVTLSHIEVAHYWGYYYFSNKVEPTKGTKGNYGAPLVLDFVFKLHNPNPYPVEMGYFKFSVAFEDIDLNVINEYDTTWIPGGKTSDYRVTGVFDVRTGLVNLLLAGATKLKEKGKAPFDQLEEWWTGIADLSFPITVKEGTAEFGADGITAIASFEGTYP